MEYDRTSPEFLEAMLNTGVASDPAGGSDEPFVQLFETLHTLTDRARTLSPEEKKMLHGLLKQLEDSRAAAELYRRLTRKGRRDG